MFSSNSEGLGCVKIILVSSANSVSLDKLDRLFIEPGKSLMKGEKATDPKLNLVGFLTLLFPSPKNNF